jgi:RNA polymerase sigma-70 factor (ECF subfamily)
VDADILGTLLTRTGRGDSGAFRALYDRSAARLFAVCLRLTRSRPLAEDMLQQIFVRIWERARQFDRASSDAMVWLITLTREHVIDVMRLGTRRPTAFDDVPDFGAVPASNHARLDGMEDGPKRALILAYRDGLSYDELSGVLGVPTTTVKTWVNRGLERLRNAPDA